MFNLARVSFVPHCLDMAGTVGISSDKLNIFAWGFSKDKAIGQLLDRIVTTLNQEAGVTYHQWVAEQEEYYVLDLLSHHTTIIQELYRLGKLSVLQQNNVPLCFILTNSPATTFLLATLNSRPLAVAWEYVD